VRCASASVRFHILVDTSYQYQNCSVKLKNGPTPPIVRRGPRPWDLCNRLEYSCLDTTLQLYHDAFDVLFVLFSFL
jgi:hypothetical protein